MKTAVSIPKDLFDGAERLAQRTGRSRSRLFSDALREYLARHAPEKITEAMDHALAEIAKPETHSCQLRPSTPECEASGDLARRNMVGGPPCAD